MFVRLLAIGKENVLDGTRHLHETDGEHVEAQVFGRGIMDSSRETGRTSSSF